MKSETTTITVRIPKTLEQDISELSGLTKRSKSYLARQAVKAYVAEELRICRMIQEGVESAERGELYTTEEVMDHVQEIIDGYETRKVV